MSNAVALLIGEVILLVIVIIAATKRITIRFRDLEVAARETASTLQCVNAAVNNVSPGAPTLIERITRLERESTNHVEETRARLARLESRLDRIEHLLAKVCDVVGVKELR